MLAALLDAALARAGLTAVVESAGTGAVAGEAASTGALAALARRGLVLEGHRSRPLSGLDLTVFDRIYVVSSRHAAHVRAQGVPAGKIHVLAAAEGGISDPFGGEAEVYEACAQQLEAEAGRIVQELGGSPA